MVSRVLTIGQKTSRELAGLGDGRPSGLVLGGLRLLDLAGDVPLLGDGQ
jgi:hypothetical protein